LTGRTVVKWEGKEKGTVHTGIEDDKVIVRKLVGDESPERGKVIGGGDDIAEAVCPSVNTFAAPTKEIGGYTLSSIVMRVKNSIGTERSDAIDKLSSRFSILQAHKEKTSNTLTSFKAAR
jgi:hypothetical protein